MTERTLLLTGFGPFPGVPVNPSEAVLRRIAAGPLARRLGIRIVTHRFDTTFAALDGLPRLVADFRPDACLHLGIAANSRFLRVETRGTNFGAPFLPAREEPPGNVGVHEFAHVLDFIDRRAKR